MSSSPPNRTSDSSPSFDASATTITRRAEATAARLTSASASSGVLSPNLAFTALVPMIATSGRKPAIWSMAPAPTSAPVTARSLPPITRTAGVVRWLSVDAVITELVMSVSEALPSSRAARSRATRAAVDPASMCTAPPRPRGIRSSAAAAMCSLASVAVASRAARLGSAALVRPAGTAPPCTRRSTPSACN